MREGRGEGGGGGGGGTPMAHAMHHKNRPKMEFLFVQSRIKIPMQYNIALYEPVKWRELMFNAY